MQDLAGRLVFDDPTSFADWLEDFDYFDRGYFGKVEPIPNLASSQGHTPTNGSFTLGLACSGSYNAGEVLLLKCYEFRADGVNLWSCSNNHFGPDDFFDNVISGIIVHDESDVIDFVVDSHFHVQCERLSVKQSNTLSLINSAAINNRSVIIHLPNQLPTPTEWIEWFTQVGINAGWRRLGDELVASEKVSENYDGWFLQSCELISETSAGLMLKTLIPHENGAFAEFDDWEQPEDLSPSEMLLKLAEIVANIEGSTVYSGNSLLTGYEWSQALAQPSFLKSLNFSERVTAGVNGWFPYLGDDGALPSSVTTPGGNVSNMGWSFCKQFP